MHMYYFHEGVAGGIVGCFYDRSTPADMNKTWGSQYPAEPNNILYFKGRKSELFYKDKKQNKTKKRSDFISDLEIMQYINYSYSLNLVLLFWKS